MAMSSLEISQDMQNTVFKILSGILRLGNIQFKGEGDGSKVTNAAGTLIQHGLSHPQMTLLTYISRGRGGSNSFWHFGNGTTENHHNSDNACTWTDDRDPHEADGSHGHEGCSRQGTRSFPYFMASRFSRNRPFRRFTQGSSIGWLHRSTRLS